MGLQLKRRRALLFTTNGKSLNFQNIILWYYLTVLRAHHAVALLLQHHFDRYSASATQQPFYM